MSGRFLSVTVIVRTPMSLGPKAASSGAAGVTTSMRLPPSPGFGETGCCATSTAAAMTTKEKVRALRMRPGLWHLQVHARDIMHVAADPRESILRGNFSLRAAGIAMAGRLEIQADIKAREKLRGWIRSGRVHHLRLRDFASEHAIHLAHRDAAVRTNRQHLPACRLR